MAAERKANPELGQYGFIKKLQGQIRSKNEAFKESRLNAERELQRKDRRGMGANGDNRTNVQRKESILLGVFGLKQPSSPTRVSTTNEVDKRQPVDAEEDEFVELGAHYVPKPVLEIERHEEIHKVFTEDCDANFKHFLIKDQLGQPVNDTSVILGKRVLISESVDESEGTIVTENPRATFCQVIQWRNAIFFLTRTNESARPTTFSLKFRKYFMKWHCRDGMTASNASAAALLERLQRDMKHPYGDKLLLFNLNTAQDPHYISCGRLHVVEYHEVSTHAHDNYFVFELLDSHALIVADVKLLPVERVWIEIHESVGIRKLYTGVVTKYAPHSALHKQDQLYNIVFTDGEAEEWNHEAFLSGVTLYERKKQETVESEIEAWQQDAV
eukprot:gene27500-34227_t